MKVYKHSTYNYITIVEIPKDELQMIDMDMCAEPRQTLKQYYNSCTIKHAIIFNCGFFSLET